jgi:hypothetical protein
MQQSRALISLMVLAAAAWAVSCADGNGSVTSPPPRSQFLVSGTYDFIAVLDTFSYETSVQTTNSDPDCPTNNSFYCTHIRTDTNGAYLKGALVIGSAPDISKYNVPDSSFVSDSFVGRFEGRFCDSLDFGPQHRGCLRLGPVLSERYLGKIGPLFRWGEQDWFGRTQTHVPNIFEALTWVRPDTDPSPALELVGTHKPDTLLGRLRWYRQDGRSPNTLYGHFTAIRRP